MLERLKQIWIIWIYPSLFLLLKPLLIGFGAIAFFIWLGVQMGWFRAPLLPLSAYEAIPKTSTFVFEVKNMRNARLQLQKTAYQDALEGWALTEKWMAENILLDSLFCSSKYPKIAEKCVMFSGAQLSGTDDFAWLHAIALGNQTFSLSKFVKNANLQELSQNNYDGERVYEYQHPIFGKWALCQSRGLLLLSRQTNLVEAAVAELQNVGTNLAAEKYFTQLRSVGQQGDMGIYINIGSCPIFMSALGQSAVASTEMLSQRFSWVGGALKITEKNFVLSGSLFHRPDKGFWDWLSTQQAASKVELGRFIPENLALMLFLNTSTFGDYYRRLPKEQRFDDFDRYILPWLGNESAFFMTEPTSADFSADKFVILQSRDSLKSKKMLEEYAQQFGILDSSRHKNYTMRQISATQLLDPIFGKKLESLRNPYYLHIDNYVIFCNSSLVMELWLDNYLSEKTIAKSEQFKPFASQMQQKSSLYLLLNSPNTAQLLKSTIDSSLQKMFDKRFLQFRQLSPIGIQLSSAEGSFAFTMSVAHQPRSIEKTKTDIAWRCRLKADAAITPALVKNHENGQYEIIVQDKENRVYLINRAGQLIWEKPVDSRIMSDIQQVDYYDNHQLQYAFSTQRAIYVLDRKGTLVKKIPLVTKASNGLLAIDYGKGLRFYIACSNGKVYGFDKSGRPLSGWSPNTNIGAAQFGFRYFEPEPEKDAIISLSKAGKLHIARRNGDPVKTHFLDGYYLSEFYIDSIGKRLALCGSNGILHIVNFQGKKFTLNPPNDVNKEVHFVLADVSGDARPDYIRQSKRLLVVHQYNNEDKIKEVLRYEYEYPQDDIFPVHLQQYNKACVGSYEISRQKISIVDGAGRLLPGFPMDGSGRFLVLDLFNDNSNTLVLTKGDMLMAYKLK